MHHAYLVLTLTLTAALACADTNPAPPPDDLAPDRPESDSGDESNTETGDSGRDTGDTGDPDAPDLPPAPPEFPMFQAQLDHAEVTHTASAIHLLAFDAADTEIGRITLYRAEGQDLLLSADFLDGSADVYVVAGQATGSGTLEADVLTQRATAITDVLAGEGHNGKLKCAVTIAAAAALCAPLAAGNPIGAVTCAAGVVTAWCGCAETLGLDDGGLCEDF